MSKAMDLATALKNVRAKKTIGGVLVVLSAIFVVLGGLKGLYLIFTSDTTVTSRLSIGLASLIRWIYAQTLVLDWIWQVAPAPDSRKLNSPGNLGFVFCLAVGFIGRSLWDSAIGLQKAIAKAREQAQSKRWEKELGHETTKAQRDVNINVVVNPVPEDEWYKRPFGLILLGVAIAALGQWINLKLGLAKL